MENLIQTFKKVHRRIISFFVSFLIIKDDKKKFKEIYRETLALLQKNYATYKYQDYVQPQWQDNTKNITEFFTKNFLFNFLRNQILKQTMFAHLPSTATEIQKTLIKKQFGAIRAKSLLREHSTGSPILNDFEFATSGNSIHHLYHLAKFEKETGILLNEINSIIELGGGYGNFAKLAKKINPEITYIIIDIPIFSYIQIVYLKTIFGNEAVSLYNPSVGIIKGSINIIPFNEPDVIGLQSAITADLFVSTWALSESNKLTQELIEKLNFFNSKHLLLAYQKANNLFEYAENIKNLVQHYDVNYNAETEYLPDNFYLFATKK